LSSAAISARLSSAISKQSVSLFTTERLTPVRSRCRRELLWRRTGENSPALTGSALSELTRLLRENTNHPSSFLKERGRVKTHGWLFFRLCASFLILAGTSK
jgi:hypothetical protein